MDVPGCSRSSMLHWSSQEQHCSIAEVKELA
jgi:hypothetical protein